MDASDSITAAVFSAFVKCPTKAHLLAIGERPPGSFFADIEARISSMYKGIVKRGQRVDANLAEPLDFSQLWRSSGHAAVTHYVDCETAVYDFTLPQYKPGERRPRESPPSPCVPVLFLPWDKPTLSDSLLVCFCALEVLQTTGTLPDTGTLI